MTQTYQLRHNFKQLSIIIFNNIIYLSVLIVKPPVHIYKCMLAA